MTRTTDPGSAASCKRLAANLRRHLVGAPMRVAEPDQLIWQWFADLCATRSYSMAGPNPIGYAEIEAYARLHRWPLAARHVDALRALDAIWLAHARPGEPAASASRPAADLTVAAFDAVFK